MDPADKTRHIPLTRAFAEVVSDGRLMGEFRDHVLLAPAALVATWCEIAPNQPVEPLEHADATDRCIVFDVDVDAAAALLRLRHQHGTDRAISFLTEYYPSVCAQTLAPGCVAESLGP